MITMGESRLMFEIPIQRYIVAPDRVAPDGTPRSAASHLGLFCLPLSHKKLMRIRTVYLQRQCRQVDFSRVAVTTEPTVTAYQGTS